MNDTWKPPNPYTLDWHAEACKAHAEGKPNPPTTDEPVTGYFRASMRKDGDFVPVVYFYSDDAIDQKENGKTNTLYCEIDYSELYKEEERLPNGQTLRQFWPYASKRPITIDQYDYYCKHDRWPEMSEAVHLSNNPPPELHPDSVAAVEHAINLLVEEAKQLVKSGAAKTQEACHQADSLIDKLSTWFEKAKDNTWKLAKVDGDPEITPEIKAHFNLYNGVGMRLRHALDACEIYKDVKKLHVLPFLKKQETEGKAPVKRSAVAGVRATTVRTQRKAIIKDYAVCLAAAASSDDVKQAVQKWANAYVRATKQAPPGCEVVEEDIAS